MKLTLVLFFWQFVQDQRRFLNLICNVYIFLQYPKTQIVNFCGLLQKDILVAT